MPRRVITTFLLFAVLILMLAGCGSSKSDSSTSYAGRAEIASQDNYASAPKESVPASGKASEVQSSADSQESPANSGSSLTISNNPVNSGHKVIQTGEIFIETLKFEESITNITKYISSIGGYIESSRIQGNRIADYGANSARNASYVFRVPQAKYSQFFTDIKAFGTIVSEQSNGDDITDKYFDTEARLKSLKIQQERLLSLLEKAQKMEDILSIEKELQNTLYEIESYTGTLKKWDSLVSFSTVTVQINEVHEILPVAPASNNGLFKRMAYGFTNSIKELWDITQDIIVFIVAALPFIVPIAFIAAIVYYFMKKKRNNHSDLENK